MPGIDRKKVSEAKDIINERAQELVDQGVNIIYFGEGTRSEDGSIKEFKKGCAYTAIATQTPLIPTFIDGSFEMKSRHNLIAKSGVALRVIFCEPIDTTGMTEEDVEELKNKARNSIIEMKKSLGLALAPIEMME